MGRVIAIPTGFYASLGRYSARAPTEFEAFETVVVRQLGFWTMAGLKAHNAWYRGTVIALKARAKVIEQELLR